MFDTMTMTKIVGGLCGTFLVFLLGNWAADSLYHVGPEGHGEGENDQAYVIAVDEGTGGGEAAAEVDFATLLASADAGKGERVFGKCKACHQTEPGVNGTGPSLHGVVGRAVGTEAGFTYSPTLAELGGAWTPERLNEFLTKPSAYAQGTKMTFTGLPKPEDRANVIAYLTSLGG